MAMTQWCVGLCGLLLAAVVALGAILWPLRPHEALGGTAPLDHLDKVRRLTRYTALVRSLLRRHTVQIICVALACVGLSTLVARPVTRDQTPAERRNRDIVLCLDVSGSMSDVDADVLSAYRNLARQLDGNRIGLVAFDSAAVTVFPLTDDAAYIQASVTQFSEELSRGPVAGTRAGDAGSSLIGDGLASCLQRFDGSDPRRGRTVVLATDNQLSGKPLFSLTDAVREALGRKVLVHGVAPAEASANSVSTMRGELRRTGGDVTLVTGAGLEDPARIVRSVQRQEATATQESGRSNQKDLVWPFGLAVLAAVLVAAMTARPRRRRSR